MSNLEKEIRDAYAAIGKAVASAQEVQPSVELHVLKREPRQVVRTSIDLDRATWNLLTRMCDVLGQSKNAIIKDAITRMAHTYEAIWEDDTN